VVCVGELVWVLTSLLQVERQASSPVEIPHHQWKKLMATTLPQNAEKFLC
jgi:hypothetical protein